MKKSVAITTIVAIHAAIIGMLLIQGCSSEPTEPQAGSAKASGEVIKTTPAETNEVVAEPKEQKLPEGSLVLRDNPTRPAEKITATDVLTEPKVEAAPAQPAMGSQDINGDIVAPAAKAPEAEAQLTTHIVKKGDSLSAIAKKYKVSLKSILKANSLNMKSSLKIGQEIKIPSATGEVIPSTAAAEKSAADVQPATIPTEGTSVYVVKKGDSLSRIAKNTHMTVSQLMSINKLKNHNIRVGQKLQIVGSADTAKTEAEPASTSPKAAKVSKAAPEMHEGEVSHKIANGETLGGIAKKYGSSVSLISERNSIKDPRKIRVGQTIVIPTKKGAKAKANKSAETVNAATPATTTAPVAPATPAALSVTPDSAATNTAAPTVTPEQPSNIQELKPAEEQPKIETSAPAASEAPLVLPEI